MMNKFLALIGKDKNTQTRRMQQCTIAAALLGCVGIFFLFRSDGSSSRSSGNEGTSITSLGEVEVQERWLERSTNRLTQLEENIDTLTKNVEESLEESKKLQNQGERLQRDWNQGIQRYQDQFDRMTGQLQDALKDSKSGTGSTSTSEPFSRAGSSNNSANGGNDISVTAPVAPPPPLVSFIRFDLSASPPPSTSDDGRLEEDGDKDPENWIAAGSHAPAVIVTGADAPTSVANQGDPRPVTLRITGKAITAANRAGVVLKTDLTGCTVTGEARGDLSSERVYVRLLRMSCREDDLVRETDVRGFVAGQGQAGVRGQVISRDESIVRSAFLGAFVEGLGTSLRDGLAVPSLVSGDTISTTNLLSDQEVVARSTKSGVAAGIGGAGKTLSDYYIKRAEQYQPVVSLKGGTEVEVVFLEGTWIDGRTSQ
jgi:conjugal transfer pilus assembly protein TraB